MGKGKNVDKCKHEWKVVTDKTLSNDQAQTRYVYISITILQCIKCGRLDKTIISNPAGFLKPEKQYID